MTARRLTEHLRILTDSFPPVARRFSFGPHGRYRIRVANDLDSRRLAYRLVYLTYAEKGYVHPHPSKMCLTLHDALPETATLLVERDGEPLAALTVVPDSPLGLPADELYRDKLDSLRADGHRLAECINLGVGLNVEEAPVLARLFNAAGFYARRVLNLTDVIASITPRHAKFYRRLLRFENLGPAKPHSRVNGTEGCLDCLPLTRMEELIVHERTPEAQSRSARTLYRDFVPEHKEEDITDLTKRNVRPMTEAELRYFFIEKTDVFAMAAPQQLAYLAERYLPYDIPGLVELRGAEEASVSLEEVAQEPARTGGSAGEGKEKQKSERRLTRILHALERRTAGEEVHKPPSGASPFDEYCKFSIAGKPHRVEVATDLQTREAAFRLMHDMYAERGWGEVHPSGLLFYLYDLLPGTVTVVVKDAESVVATLTVVFDSPLGLPDEDTYGKEFDKLRVAGRRLAQVISLGVRNDLRAGAAVLIRLFNFAYFVARGIGGATDFVHTVVPRHASFYVRKMLFEQVGEERLQRKTDVKVVLLRLDFSVSEAEVLREHSESNRRARTLYGQFNTVEEVPEVVTAIKRQLRSLSPGEVSRLLAKRPEIWAKASAEQKAYLRSRTDHRHVARTIRPRTHA